MGRGRKKKLIGETRICSICGIEKPISKFNKYGYKDSLRSDCRECRHIHHYDQSKTKDNTLKRKYGISLDEYYQMLEAQDNKCAICPTNITDLGSAHVDHDHETGKVRGLLCDCCNIGLGHFRDNSNTLYSAADYLMKTL